MKRGVLATALLLSGLSAVAGGRVIEIGNTLDEFRIGEIVEVDASRLPSGPFILRDFMGKEVAWQRTHDGKIVFRANVGPRSVARYSLSEGTPSPVDTCVYGRCFPERLDDMSWENEWSAYRAYGPALQRSGERGYGYDVWCKSVDNPVLEKRYFDHLRRSRSFHVDHGEGMDVYEVGQTLGGGTAALVGDDGNVAYPWGWNSYEILDNGPLRFTVRLDYDGDPTRETRLITLDSGDPVNRTVVDWHGTQAHCAVAGFPVHRPVDGSAEDISRPVFSDGVLTYADPTQGPVSSNGEIFLAVFSTCDGQETEICDWEASKGNAVGEAYLHLPYTPGEPVVYYWGSAWSKGKIRNAERWRNLVAARRRALQNPFKVVIK